MLSLADRFRLLTELYCSTSGIVLLVRMAAWIAPKCVYDVTLK